jgi:hypothetical protein
MISYKFTNDSDRTTVIDKVKHLKNIDIGGATSIVDGYLTAIVDFNHPKAKAKEFFQGNINNPLVWSKVGRYVKDYGKFDFAICTHTLEDICNPSFVCSQIESIAKAGFIVVPSKYIELARLGNHFRGFIHHRWIFDIVDGVFTGFPKLNLIEHPRFDAVKGTESELQIWWEGEIGLQIINNDFLGPDDESVQSYYNKLL